MYDNIKQLFEGTRSLSLFLIENEDFSHKDSESSDTYSCGYVSILLDGERLLNISGTEHYFSDIRDEAFGLKVESGWNKFTILGKRRPRLEFGEAYYDTPDFSELWCYTSLDNCEIKVELEVVEEELSDPYSEHVKSVKVLKAIIIKSPTKTVYIGQRDLAYVLIVTTDIRKMQFDV
ncbi:MULTISPECIES: hypothetical protein [unclassified Bacillus (in: firmicutes)]|uniref:hypothetical protein n=1 Tax=unclassified Bacillus (in: firmicutes) TaxID=185979 RepID=UPI000B89FF58|nr:MULTISPECIES: hypothetical protein [unclassified Bacillus (in: firmicutes)]